MKRLISFLVVLSLALGCVSVASAAISITQQPETQTVKAGGSLTFKVKAKNSAGQSVTWYFTNPANGEVTTGRKLEAAVKGVKVSNPNGLNITLKKIPEAMHGWTLYCHIGPKSGGVNSDTVMILISGMEPPVTGAVVTPAAENVEESTSSGNDETSVTATEDTGSTQVVYATPEPSPITISAGNAELYALDRNGNPTGAAQSELSFDVGTKANFYVKIPEGTEGVIQYVTLGSLRLTPEGDVTGMSIRGWDSSAVIKVKTITEAEKTAAAEKAAALAAEEAEIDESQLATITCEYCRFTGWHNTFAESGKVPIGSTITVIASGGIVGMKNANGKYPTKSGYYINGATETTHRGEATFQMVVEGDTTIVMNKDTKKP